MGLRIHGVILLNIGEVLAIFEENWTPGSTLETEARAWKERVGGVILEHELRSGVRVWGGSLVRIETFHMEQTS